MGESAFGPTLERFDESFAGVKGIGGLPVSGTASCFKNWLFQKLSFFISS